MNKQERAKVALIRQKIASDTAFAVRVFKVIWDRQKPSEKFTLHHQGHDGRGFRESETYTLNLLYEELEAQEWKLSAYQADMVRERMQPYAGQYFRASQERREQGRSQRARVPVGNDSGGSTTGRTINNREVDSLRDVFANMSDQDKLDAITRMGDRMGV